MHVYVFTHIYKCIRIKWECVSRVCECVCVRVPASQCGGGCWLFFIQVCTCVTMHMFTLLHMYKRMRLSKFASVIFSRKVRVFLSSLAFLYTSLRMRDCAHTAVGNQSYRLKTNIKRRAAANISVIYRPTHISFADPL